MLQGFLTRAHLALRLSFPVTQARRALVRLIAVTLATGVPVDLLSSALVSLGVRYPMVFKSDFHALVLGRLQQQDMWSIHAMGV